MFLRGIFFIFIFLSTIQFSVGQLTRRQALSRQLNFGTDNDFLLITDRYYTFGMDIEFNSLVDPVARLYKRIAGDSDSSKIVWNFHYGNKVFTPSNISTRQTSNMDRPYAGWNFLYAGITIYNKPRAGHDFGIETGLVGEVSGMGRFQQWWHRLIHIYPVNGWESQIANEAVVNLKYSYLANIPIAKRIDLVSITKATAGTGANNLGEEIILRFLKFNPINNSAFTQARVSWSKKTTSRLHREAFFFLGLGGEYVVSNIFIEGSLFKSNRSEYTLEAKNLVLTRRAGFTYSTDILNYSLTWYHVGKEISNTRNSNYLSMAMAVRF
jgi:hypothetical protein